LNKPIVSRDEDKAGGIGILKDLSTGIHLPFIDTLTPNDNYK